MILRRLLGLVMLLIGLTGVGLCIAGMIVTPRVVDNIAASIDDNLVLAAESLDTVQETLDLAQESIDEVTEGLDTVEESAVHLGQTLNQTRPLLDEVGEVASDDIPDSLDAVQATMPDLVQVAAAIDDALTVLNNFRIDEEILGLKIEYDLGVDYNPSVPFDQSVESIGQSFEALPGRLRALDEYVAIANENLEMISADVLAISQDLDDVNGRIAELDPLLVDYQRILLALSDSNRQTRQLLQDQLAVIKQIVTVALIWVALSQLAPLYLGIELLRGRSMS